jgi:isopentenyl phosphate kinase
MDAKESRRRQRLMDISKGNPYENIKKLSPQEISFIAHGTGGYTHPSLTSTKKTTSKKKPKQTKKGQKKAKEAFKKRQGKRKAAPSESHLD